MCDISTFGYLFLIPFPGALRQMLKGPLLNICPSFSFLQDRFNREYNMFEKSFNKKGWKQYSLDKFDCSGSMHPNWILSAVLWSWCIGHHASIKKFVDLTRPVFDLFFDVFCIKNTKYNHLITLLCFFFTIMLCSYTQRTSFNHKTWRPKTRVSINVKTIKTLIYFDTRLL